MSVSVFL